VDVLQTTVLAAAADSPRAAGEKPENKRSKTPSNGDDSNGPQLGKVLCEPQAGMPIEAPETPVGMPRPIEIPKGECPPPSGSVQ